MKKYIEKEIQIPTLPNFLRIGKSGIEDESVVLPLSDFTEDELQEIGMEWTKQLIAKSKVGK